MVKNMKKVQENIEILKEKYKSYNKTAKALGITGAAINYLIHGETVAKDETIIKIANELKIEPEEMLLESAKDRSKGKAKEYWVQIEKKLASVAATILVASTLPSILNNTLSILCQIAGFQITSKLEAQAVTRVKNGLLQAI